MRTLYLHTATLALLLMTGVLSAQIRVTETHQLDTPTDGMWGYARFSPDGARIYFTTLSYAGIWEHDVQSQTTREITREEGSGFGFALSPDGKNIAYRRTIRGATWTDKKQEIVVADVASGTSETIASARTISTPSFLDDAVTYVEGNELKPVPPKKSSVYLQGIVNQKIMMVVNGTERSIDPLGNGSYIWPSLSPDKTQVLAYDMDHGAIISSVSGELQQRLGRAEGPSWTRDGKWVVFFSETNDGYRITGGDLHVIGADGSGKTALTNTPSRVELFPSCSPTENKIVCHTMDGKLLLLTYTVIQ